MCYANVILHICSICNTRAAKPSGKLEKCAAAPASGPHCGVLRDPTPDPDPADPALNPSGLEFEALKVAPGYTLIDASHRRPKPKLYTCELCLDHLGPEEAKARAQWWRKEQRSVLKGGKRVTPGPSTAGWADVLRK
ncbi:hypothetical protein CGCSCA4_v007216 [Colletotrichum siamense]|uniref:Uncharacterized protein n=1 Tax=Colletotrichum siamense TaxID=690259 RepID=A0A9P5K5E7_COLSI|nr:hypothetical protein CGCSCA4_v007216 [Colletotrichum siamense]KAF4858829.1 hypothetical protein CGCSCA2_v006766 [Colletotrichum siamense]